MEIKIPYNAVLASEMKKSLIKEGYKVRISDVKTLDGHFSVLTYFHPTKVAVNLRKTYISIYDKPTWSLEDIYYLKLISGLRLQSFDYPNLSWDEHQAVIKACDNLKALLNKTKKSAK